MTRRVMLDLETLGTTPGAAIVSIGAVRFGPDGLGDELHISVDTEDCLAHGLHRDETTMEEFWNEQPPEVRQVLDGGRGLDVALDEFARFCDGVGEIWANAPHFDCAILAAAYRTLDRQPPWEYWQPRDVRTLRETSPYWPQDMDQQGTEHNALADARYQARCVAVCLGRQQAATDGGES